MKIFSSVRQARSGFLAAVAMAIILTGCAAPKVDWPGRVGNYTFDQAVLELGPPDKDAKLEDGTLVAEWLTRRGYAYSSPPFGYSPWSPYSAYYPMYVDSYTPDYFLRLTFGPDGKLKSWKKLAR